MLSQDERLRKTFEFRNLYQRNNFAISSFITMHYLQKQPDMTNEYPRVGFVVSKKISNKACKRNKIKRRMRYAYSELKKNYRETFIQLGTLVFTVRVTQEKNVLKPYSEILDHMEKCLRKIVL